MPAATQWDLMAAAWKLLWPVLAELIRQAAQGSVMHNDDTSMRILRLAREPGDKHETFCPDCQFSGSSILFWNRL